MLKWLKVSFQLGNPLNGNAQKEFDQIYTFDQCVNS